MRLPPPKGKPNLPSKTAHCAILTTLTLWLLPTPDLLAEPASGRHDETLDSRPDLTRNRDRKAMQRSADHVIDEKGRRLRVGFPLYDRFVLESGAGLATALPWKDEEGHAQGDRFTGVMAPGFGLGLHKSLALDFNDEDIWWMLRHTFLKTTYRRVEEQGGARLRAALIDGQYLRHDLSSFIVVPRGDDDLRLPANFDIAADYKLLEIEGENDDLFAPRAGFHLSRVETLSAALLMDFVRDESYRKRFAVGVSGWHTMRRTEQGTWRHELSPLAAIKVLYGVDHGRGLVRRYGEVTCGGEIGLDSAEGMAQSAWSMRCRAKHELEWVFMSVNDRPVSVPFEVSLDMPLAARERGVVEATLGLRVGLTP